MTETPSKPDAAPPGAADQEWAKLAAVLAADAVNMIVMRSLAPIIA